MTDKELDRLLGVETKLKAALELITYLHENFGCFYQGSAACRFKEFEDKGKDVKPCKGL